MDFGGDERGQSIQIGAILLFAALIITFSSYQAVVVPEQNRRVEFDHNQQVQRDLVDVRNTLLETYTGGDDGYAAVKLGTTFPARLVTTNPAPPSGTLRTTEPRPFIVETGGTDRTAVACDGITETRFLEYEPSYSLYQGAGTLRVESSVLYHNFTEAAVPLTGQTLVEGDTINIIPMTGDFDAGGTRTVAIEPTAGTLTTRTYMDPNVTVPTNLNENQWVELLSSDVDSENITVTTGTDGRNLTLALDGEWDIACGPVGLGEEPATGGRGDRDVRPGEIAIESVTVNDANVTARVNSTADWDTNLTGVQMPFVSIEKQGVEGRDIDPYDVLVGGTLRADSYEIGDPLRPLDPAVELPGNNTERDITLRFENGSNDLSGGGFIVLILEFESGETGTYYLTLPSTGGGAGGGPGAGQ